MTHPDDRHVPSRMERAWAELGQMKTRSAVKWAALTMGGSVGILTAMTVIETLVRWTVAGLSAVAGLFR